MGELRLYELFVDVVYVTAPVVTVTAPTGAITTTTTPTVTWTNSLDADGGPQTAAKVRIFSAAQYGAGGFNPATSASSSSSDVTGPATTSRPAGLLADGTYRAYVQTSQTVNGAAHPSAWAYSAFTVAVARPGVPLVTLVAQPTSGRIEITINDVTGPATTTGLEVERSVDGTVTWQPVRSVAGLGALILATDAVVNDYEAPNGTATTYRARAHHHYADETAASAWSTPASATWTSTSWWVKHPIRPALNVPLDLAGYGPVTRAARQGRFQPLGASLPIVIDDTRQGAAGQTTVRLTTTAQLNLLTALLATTDTLLLQGPVAAGEPDRYVRCGDQVSTRLLDNAAFHRRDVILPWVEVAMPTGALLLV